MSESNTHTLTNFEQALKEARKDVLRMASIAGQNFTNAIEGLLSRNSELCNEAIVEDDEVNALEMSIDAASFEILIRYNPMAGDLRQVLSGMKISNNLERISDEAESIARRARKVLKHAEVPEIRMIEPLYEMALNLVQDSVRSYAEGDTDLGLSLYEKDKVLDKAHLATIKQLSKTIDKDTSHVKTYLHLIFIVRSIERIGDHAVNIAEDGIFVESAADVRHMGPKQAAVEVENS